MLPRRLADEHIIHKKKEQKMKVAVVGGGHAGFACAGKLALDGHDVNLYELPELKANIEEVQEAGGIEVEGVGKTGFASLRKITTDIEEALRNVDLVEIIVPAFGHRRMCELCAPLIRNGQTVVFFGKGGGALLFHRSLHELGKKVESLLVGETSGIPPFSARKSSPTKVYVSIELKDLPLASFPGRSVDKLLAVLKDLYPSLVPATNILETILMDLNLVGHAAAALLNVGRIEYSGPFRIWKEGVTPSVAKVIQAVDEERLAVMRALDLKNAKTYVEMSRDWGMCPKESDTYQKVINTKYIAPKNPTDVKTHRYISEDVPYSMVTCSSIGDMIGVPTPVINSIITIFSAMNDTDYWEIGRTVDTLGIAGLTIDQLKTYVNEGV